MLFKSSTELKAYAQLSGEVNFASLKPTLRFVEVFHIAAILGKELYASLDSAYTNNSTLTAPQVALLEQCRQVIAPWFCYYYAPKADVQLGDSGMTKNKDAAYQYQGTAFRESNLREAELCEELLLQFLEDGKDDFPQWVTSSAFKSYRALFIKTGSEFNTLFPSASPQRTYFAMRSKMVDVEEQMIRMAIGDALFTSLKTKDAGTQAFTSVEKELLFKLKKAIAYQTVALAVPMFNVRIDASGLSIVAQGPRTSDDNVTSRAPAPDSNISLLIQSCADSAKMWLSNATAYLLANAIALSYTAPVTSPDCSTTNNSVNADLYGAFGLC